VANPVRQPETLVNSARTFFGAPLSIYPNQISADIAFIGVPFGSDDGSSRAAEAVRDAPVYYYADRRGDSPAKGYYDYDLDTDFLKGITMVDAGDVPIGKRDVEGNFRRIEATLAAIVDRGVFPVVIGGSHAIAAPALRGYGKYQPIDVVHIDGHHDFYPPVRGNLSAGALRRISDEVPFARDLTTIGLRPAAAPHTGRDVYEAMKQRGVRIITARRFRELGAEAAAAEVPKADRNIYITLDIDVLDTAVAPNVGVAAPGGLSYLEISELLKQLNSRGNVVGIDMVSVTPGGTTALVAAQLILDFLSVRFPSKS
jgi:agmatinase